MNPDKNRRRALLSWLMIATFLVLCGVLGFLQYTWIGQVSEAENVRLHGTLQASLNRLGRDLSAELSAARRAIAPDQRADDLQQAETELSERYLAWKKSTRRPQTFQRIAVAAANDSAASLRILDPETGELRGANWPAEWQSLRDRLSGPPSGPDSTPDSVFLQPLLHSPPPKPPEFGGRGPHHGRPEPRGRREASLLIFEVNVPYVRETLLPELLQHHLGSGGALDYQVEVVSRANPATVVYQSDPSQGNEILRNADASIGLFDLQGDSMWPNPFEHGPGRGPGRGPGPGPGPPSARWQMYVRHRAGSLEAVVAQTRLRSLAVTAGVLLLMLASAGALIRFTRSAQKLAALEMDFVAGVSHELRTPLTVIHTAAYNLQGSLSRNPAQVARYGALIQNESERLQELVAQVLNFSSAKAGRLVKETRPVSVERVIEEAMESSRTVIEGTHSVVQTSIDSGLPPILGDPMALKHALQNLVTNAARYGTENDKWIGIFAMRATGEGEPAVEIRVADHGPGIPREEQSQVFDPFFRGKRAVEDQIHGTGLGLSLVKAIVEAHGGTIVLHSEPSKGTEFIVRLPISPLEQSNEYAHSLG